MSNPNADLVFLEDALPQLQEYLLSNQLYWPLSSSSQRLTPGSILISFLRVAVFAPDHRKILQDEFDVIRKRWRSAWEKVAERELSNRLNLWSQYLVEVKPSSDGSRQYYKNEVRNRVLIQLLLEELPANSFLSNIASIDNSLRTIFRQGDFIWEADLQSVFPSGTYWFLYGKIVN